MSSDIGVNTDIGGGQAADAINIGAGVGIFAGKVSEVLQFKSLVAGTNITLTPSGDEILIGSTGGGGGGGLRPEAWGLGLGA